MAIPSYTNLPGVFADLQDKGLRTFVRSTAPRVLVIGTASKGFSDQVYVVGRATDAAVTFGTGGTLTRGMWETKAAGAENVVLFRMGATAASVAHVGDSAGVGGYTIETLKKDDSAGTDYEIFYDDSEDRLIVYRAADGVIVYDNSTSSPADLGEVIVSGSRAGGGGPDIGAASAGVAITAVTATGTLTTAGTDGLNPSRMKQFEYLFKAYKLLETEEFDLVVPMDVYLDDKNTADGSTVTVTGNTYPTPGGTFDGLGKVFVQEYQGEFYFFWDTDGDGDAELWPAGVGSASSTTDIDGNSLDTSSFHEVNFAYQLARFCYVVSTNNRMCHGVISTRPPTSLKLADIASWVGKLPTYTLQSDGTEIVSLSSDNGTGLLGNKFLGGKYGFRSGAKGGGFIATDTDFMDGTEQTDRAGNIVDIGRHISITAALPRVFNSFDTSGVGYLTAFPTTYAGMISRLPANSAPTNKVVASVRLPFSLRAETLDRLTGVRLVTLRAKPKGIVVSDAPTAALSDSDYTRLTTFRIINDSVQAVRTACDSFIGEAVGSDKQAAMETAINGGLDKLVKAGWLTRKKFTVQRTPSSAVLGECTIELELVPAFELRRIFVVVSLLPE